MEAARQLPPEKRFLLLERIAARLQLRGRFIVIVRQSLADVRFAPESGPTLRSATKYIMYVAERV